MSLLQELLNAGVVDIGSDDSRFEKMQSAASVLAARFEQEPQLLVPATLISLDNSVDENDPIFVLVEELVIAEWKTLRNTHVNRPRELLRSIIIDALSTATHGKAEAAGVVWNAAASPLRHGQVRLGKTGPIVERLIKTVAQIAEKEAVNRTSHVPLPSAKPDPAKGTTEGGSLNIKATIKDDDVLIGVARAVGPTNQQNQPLETPNPHWPNTGQPWSFEFSQRMAEALVKAVNLGTGRLIESLNKNVAGLLGRIGDRVREAEQLQYEMSEAHATSRMRLDVLWWSESLYSPSTQEGYRDLALPVAAVVAAADLTAIVPALAPATVCYILGETVYRLAKILDTNVEQPIVSLLQMLTEAKPNLGDGFPSVPTNDMRLSLLDLVGEACSGRTISSETLRSRAGIDGAIKLFPADLAMWVFRDLQARRLVKELS